MKRSLRRTSRNNRKSRKLNRFLFGGRPVVCKGLTPESDCPKVDCTWVNRGVGYCMQKRGSATSTSKNPIVLRFNVAMLNNPDDRDESQDTPDMGNLSSDAKDAFREAIKSYITDMEEDDILLTNFKDDDIKFIRGQYTISLEGNLSKKWKRDDLNDIIEPLGERVNQYDTYLAEGENVDPAFQYLPYVISRGKYYKLSGVYLD